MNKICDESMEAPNEKFLWNIKKKKHYHIHVYVKS